MRNKKIADDEMESQQPGQKQWSDRYMYNS